MDIYTIIRNDHAIARGLIARTHAARSPEWRYELCRELSQAVRAHSRAEEEVFYAALLRYPEVATLLKNAEEEHADVESLLDEALSMAPDSEIFMRTFEAATAELNAHMEYEEETVFAAAREVLNELQAHMLGLKMRGVKDDYIEAEFMGSPTLRADAGYYA